MQKVSFSSLTEGKREKEIFLAIVKARSRTFHNKCVGWLNSLIDAFLFSSSCSLFLSLKQFQQLPPPLWLKWRTWIKTIFFFFCFSVSSSKISFSYLEKTYTQNDSDTFFSIYFNKSVKLHRKILSSLFWKCFYKHFVKPKLKRQWFILSFFWRGGVEKYLDDWVSLRGGILMTNNDNIQHLKARASHFYSLNNGTFLASTHSYMINKQTVFRNSFNMP